MPSIFHKSRRSSEGIPPQLDNAVLSTKRQSMDAGATDSTSSGKLKSLFHSAEGGKFDSMKKRLNISHREDIASDLPPTTTTAASSQLSTNSIADAASPRSPNLLNASESDWQPSYPLVVPDDESYVDIAPDGQVNGTVNAPTSPVRNNENSLRRSTELFAAPDAGLSAYPTMQPTAKKVVPAQTQLPTPPSSDSPGLVSNEPPVLPALDRQKMISLDSPLTPAPSTPSSPAPRGTTSRPGMASRKTSINVINSPPMPRPIANLPTLGGFPGFTFNNTPASGSRTPGWSSPTQPKTPGWAGLSSPTGPKTPSWTGMSTPRTPGPRGGFPFTPAMAAATSGTSRVNQRTDISEEELRKLRRAMPVMLREPSFRPPENDGGEAGDDDDDSDGESETEVERHDEDDSEGETETERAIPTKPVIPTRNLLKGKGKKKANAAGPSIPMDAVREEEDPPSPPMIKRNLPPPKLANLRPIVTTASSQGSAKSVWSLPTPKRETPQSQSHGSWMQFGSQTPAQTPGPTTPWNRARQTDVSGPSTSSLSRTHSTTGSSIHSSSGGSSGYFDSMPTSHTASSAALPLTPRAAEPVLNKGSGQPVLSSASVVNGTSTNGRSLAPALQPLGEETTTSQEDHHADAESGDEDDVSDRSSMDHASGSASNTPSPAPVHQAVMERPSPSTRPSLYHQASQSMVNLSTPRDISADLTRGSGADVAPSHAPNLATIPSSEAVPTRITIPTGPFSPNAEWAKPPPTPAVGMTSSFFGGDKLKRRRSADDMTAIPPMYEPPFPGTVIPRPRDEEGREKLPEYWCAVHIEGTLSRKMEFAAPGVQSRDRAWKKSYFMLRGTTLYVYKFDPHKFPLKVDAPVPILDESDTEVFLHVHLPGERRASLSASSAPQVIPGPRRGSLGDAGIAAAAAAGRRGSDPRLSTDQSDRRSSVSSGSPSIPQGPDTKDANLFNTPRRSSVSTGSQSSTSSTGIAGHLPFQHNSLIKQYTLQLAESGLAADYVKRRNVVRVRAEGEQFLLQTENAKDVVDWIEAFQAATNVALDLDERPMPKIITLPRRRRRRPATGTAVTTDAATAAAGSTAAATAAAARDNAADRREALLAEDQAQV